MTVENQNTSVIFTGNGVSTQFPYSFRIPEITMVDIALLDAATNEVVQVLNPGSYTITGVSQDNYDGGMVTYPLAGDPLSSDYKIYIGRTVEYTQGLDLVNQGGFYPESIEYQLDKVIFQIQQLKSGLDRSYKTNLGVVAGTFGTPPADHLIVSDGNGNFIDGGLKGGAANIDPSAFATAAQGVTADTAVQPGDPEALPTDGTLGQVLMRDPSSPSGRKWSSAVPGGDGYMLESAYDPDGIGSRVVFEADGTTQPYASRSAAQAASPVASAKAISVLSSSGYRLDYVYDAAGTALETADGRKWSPNGVIYLDHFGDNTVPGTTDTASLWAAALDWAVTRTVKGLPTTYRTTDTIEILNDRQKIELPNGAQIVLDTATTALNVVKCSGDGSAISGGAITTTLRSLAYLVRLVGEGSRVENSKIYFATRSTNTNMVYNHGGVELAGDKSVVRGCEIYNMEGIGCIVHAAGCEIYANSIHDNITGIHGDQLFSDEYALLIQNNVISNNNVNTAQGADGILCGGGFIAQIIGNRISGSGEHGMYCYAKNAVVTGNIVTGNTCVGIKVRDCHDTVVSSNSVYSNNTSGTTGQSEIYVQCTLTSVQRVQIVNNSVVSISGQGGIRSVFGAAGFTIDDLIVSGNTVNGDIDLAFTTGASVQGNTCTGNITVGSSGTYAPNPQTGAFVQGNKCAVLSQGRCGDSYFGPNVCTSFASSSNNTGNRYVGIKATGQATAISRRSFTDMYMCSFDLTALGSTSFLTQGANAAGNSNKIIALNRFKNAGQRVIDDSTSGISGSYNVLMGNFGSGASQPMYSLWGAGHSLIGNVNPDGGGTGYVGMNSSWMLGNSPKIVERSGTTGNQNV